MKQEHKRGIINACIMVFLCAFFVLGIEMSKRPSAEGLAGELLQLDGYAGGVSVDVEKEVYAELYSLGATKVVAYSVPETGREFAIAEFKNDAPQDAGRILRQRVLQLKEELAENADVLLVNRFAVLMIYDDDTARNCVLSYCDIA